MKSNSADLVVEMALIALSLCDTLLQKNDTDKEEALNRSFEAKSKCISELQKEFLPPFDREDIANIALSLHRLNERLCDLIGFSKIVYPASETVDALMYVSNVCKTIGRFNLKKTYDTAELLIPRPFNSYSIIDGRYNPYRLICEHCYFDLLKCCCDEAELLLDYLLRTVIKNS